MILKHYTQETEKGRAVDASPRRGSADIDAWRPGQNRPRMAKHTHPGRDFAAPASFVLFLCV